MTYVEIYGLHESMVGGVWVRKSRCGGGITFGYFLLLSSRLLCLHLGPVPSVSAWGYPPPTVGGVSPYTVSRKWSSLSCSNRLWHIWVRTYAYIGRLLHSLFLFPSILLHWLRHPWSSVPKERDNLTTVRYQGPGNIHSI
jgi:hypothetical protein